MITIRNISKVYTTKKQQVNALNNVSLEIEEGESLAILGLNGSGKSTLVNMITGIISPTEGEVRINNLKPEEGKIYRKQFSVVYQNNGLDFFLSVYDNLKTNGYIYGLRGNVLYNAIEEVMDLMDLQKYRKSKISELSGGYAKRVQVSKALMLDTPIIILDEPTHGMDPLIKNKLFQIINKRKQEGRVIIYTTQILEEVEKICNHVAILKNGYLISKDTITNTKQKFSNHHVLEISLSNTKRNNQFKLELLEKMIKEFHFNVISYEIKNSNLKIVSEMDINSIIIFSNQLREYIDIEELNISKASLEEILLNMEKESEIC